MIIDWESKNKIYMCHFPGKAQGIQDELWKKIKNKKFSVDKRITVITIADRKTLNTCLLAKQVSLTYNENALDAEWQMNKKIGYIVELLEKCNSEYCVITDARDVLITADLDKYFISNFLKYDCDILYNATTTKYPKVNLPSDYQIEGGMDGFNYLNAGVCIGKTEALLKWYKYCQENFIPESRSEQFILRKNYSRDFKIKIDGKRKLFRVCHYNDTVWFKSLFNFYFAKGGLISLDDNFKYKYTLPNKKTISGKIKNFSILDDKNRKIFVVSSNELEKLDRLKEKTNLKSNTLALCLDEKPIDVEQLKKYCGYFVRFEFCFGKNANFENFYETINQMITSTYFNHIGNFIFETLPDGISLPYDERISIREEGNNHDLKIKKWNRYFKIKRYHSFSKITEYL